MSEPYNETHQTRLRPNTPFEDLLGDSIERAFSAGKYDPPSLLEHLNRAGPPCPLNSGEWTADTYSTLMAKLGA
jgi:hypothetical protein